MSRKRTNHFWSFVVYFILWFFSGYLALFPVVIGGLIGGESGVKIAATVSWIATIIFLILWVYHLIKWIF